MMALLLRSIIVPTGSRSSAETPRCAGPSIMDNVDTSAKERALGPAPGDRSLPFLSCAFGVPLAEAPT